MKKCYYYKTLNSEGNQIYKCLFDHDDLIYEYEMLNLKNQKNMAMNNNFLKSDNELKRFRTELNKYNDELKSILFKNKNNQCFRIDVFNYYTIKEAIYNTCIINSKQKLINQIPNIDDKEFYLLENCICSGLMRIAKK